MVICNRDSSLSHNSLLWLLFVSVLVTVGQANSPPSFAPIPNTNPQKYYDMDKERFREDQQTGIVIYTLIASDPDGDSIDFSIKTDHGDDFFEISSQNNTHATVVLKQLLDYESKTRHDITWLLDDGVNSAVETEITVYVLDINDNDPQFIGLPYQVDVNENHPVFTSIFTVSVEDIDESTSQGGSITLYEKNITAGTFDIIDHGDWKADVILIAELDYEVTAGYELTLVAEDDGNDPATRTSTASLTVFVIDVQDEPPMWIGEPYFVRVTDETEVNSTILTVAARDGDRSEPNEIEYFVSNETVESDIGGYLDINQFSGEIFVREELVEELVGHHNFTILAVENDDTQTLATKVSRTTVRLEIELANPIPDADPADLTTVATTITVLVFGLIAALILGICMYNTDNNFKKSKKNKIAAY